MSTEKIQNGAVTNDLISDNAINPNDKLSHDATNVVQFIERFPFEDEYTHPSSGVLYLASPIPFDIIKFLNLAKKKWGNNSSFQYLIMFNGWKESSGNQVASEIFILSDSLFALSSSWGGGARFRYLFNESANIREIEYRNGQYYYNDINRGRYEYRILCNDPDVYEPVIGYSNYLNYNVYSYPIQYVNYQLKEETTDNLLKHSNCYRETDFPSELVGYDYINNSFVEKEERFSIKPIIDLLEEILVTNAINEFKDKIKDFATDLSMATSISDINNAANDLLSSL